jgi:hypothetical protein
MIDETLRNTGADHSTSMLHSKGKDSELDE